MCAAPISFLSACNSRAYTQLAKLDKQLEASLANLEAQKVHASKWMHQQNVRIMVQAEESVAARMPMADFFAANLKLLRAIEQMSATNKG